MPWPGCRERRSTARMVARKPSSLSSRCSCAVSRSMASVCWRCSCTLVCHEISPSSSTAKSTKNSMNSAVRRTVVVRSRSANLATCGYSRIM